MCGKRLNTKTAKQVELSNTDGLYYQGGIPQAHVSQGWFDVGSDCFKKANPTTFRSIAEDAAFLMKRNVT